MHFDSAIRPYSDVNFDVILGLTILKMRHYGENTKFLKIQKFQSYSYNS